MIINGRFNTSLTYICTLNETIFGKLSTQALMAFYPMPMTEKPLDWRFEDNNIHGGYVGYQYEMVRAKKKYLNYKSYKGEIFDSINYIQSTPWRVNETILKAVKNDLRMPLKSDYIKALYPDAEGCMFELKLSDDDLNSGLSSSELSDIKNARKVFQQEATLYRAEVKDFESAVGKYRAVKMAVEIADDYSGKVIYFPHSYDSRGRIYPIPVGLTPQGSDAVKAMLEYDNGQVLNQDGLYWAFAYLATLYGDDKLHFEERVQRGLDLLDADYRDADEPYQFLSHQLELNKIVEDPRAIFKGRIHLDACNSGSQFTSALTGDKAGCLATNVIPTIKEDGFCDRQDAYLLVSNRSIELTEKVLDTNLSEQDRKVYELLLELLKKSGRKICKRPVMVSNYGGTAGGRADMIFNMFRELGVERKYITQSNAVKFAKIQLKEY